ncbi:MAG TPA: pyridoxal phosphate-dependent aminotransferase [Candidatus Cybelea sp.]|nr:pyridoxal phosphate-dependent aminotransferase [Candidatus Cybelea sp.]
MLKSFLLEDWLEANADPMPEFPLGGSTGPVWTMRSLLELDGRSSLERMLQSDVHYSRAAGATALRQAIAQMQDVPMEHVLIMTGAAEALSHIFSAVAQPGANVVVPAPCFPPYSAVPEALGLEVRAYRLRREDAYEIDLDEIRRLTDSQTKLILVNSPHNPTGSILDEKTMEALHDFAVERGVQFVSDEVYHPIYHGAAMASASRLASATVVGDFSKAFALSGLRVGWIVEADERRRDLYLTAREYLTVSNSPITEFLAEIAVRHRQTIFDRTREVARTHLTLLEPVLKEHAGVVGWIPPRGGMIAFPWLVSGADSRNFCDYAAAHGLLFAPGDCFGVQDHFRIALGVGRDWYPAAMKRLGELLAAWPAAAERS